MAFVFTSSIVIWFLLTSLERACYLEIKVGVKLGAALALPPVGKFMVGKLPILVELLDEEEDGVAPEAYEVGTLRESRRSLTPTSGWSCLTGVELATKVFVVEAVFKLERAPDLILLLVVELILTVLTDCWLLKRLPVLIYTVLPSLMTKTMIRSSTAPVESCALILIG